jgi:hypothetical protein
MTSLFAPLWNHIYECDVCSHVDLALCSEGQRIQKRAFETAAERIAPIPVEREEPSS